MLIPVHNNSLTRFSIGFKLPVVHVVVSVLNRGASGQTSMCKKYQKYFAEVCSGFNNQISIGIYNCSAADVLVPVLCE